MQQQQDEKLKKQNKNVSVLLAQTSCPGRQTKQQQEEKYYDETQGASRLAVVVYTIQYSNIKGSIV